MKIRLNRAWFFGVSLSIFVLVLLFLDDGSIESASTSSGDVSLPSVETDQSTFLPPLPSVSVLETSVTHAQLEISAYGELRPKWDVTIKSPVSGMITTVAPFAETGARVRAGDVLIEFDRTRYQAQLDQAVLAFEQATLDVTLAQRRTRLARLDWERSGSSEPPGDLMLFKPQLALAEKARLSAGSHLRLAQKLLSDTRIKAAFEGVLVERTAGIGQFVVEGESLFRLVEDQSLLLEVAIGEAQWQDLAENWRGQTVALYSSQNQRVGAARLARGGQVLDQQSRQFSLSLDVLPEMRDQARAGQYVRVTLPGRRLDTVLSLPESALTQDGTVWLVDHENRLHHYRPQNHYSQNGRVLVAPPPQTVMAGTIWRVATHPMAYFMAGKQVDPKPVTPDSVNSIL